MTDRAREQVKVVVMDLDDFDKLVELARELKSSWDGMTMGERFERRRSIGGKMLYRLRGVIANAEDLGL